MAHHATSETLPEETILNIFEQLYDGILIHVDAPKWSDPDTRPQHEGPMLVNKQWGRLARLALENSSHTAVDGGLGLKQLVWCPQFSSRRREYLARLRRVESTGSVGFKHLYVNITTLPRLQTVVLHIRCGRLKVSPTFLDPRADGYIIKKTLSRAEKVIHKLRQQMSPKQEARIGFRTYGLHTQKDRDPTAFCGYVWNTYVCTSWTNLLLC